MALPGAGGHLSASGCLSEDPNKRIRKPYAISKSRESWTDPEHDRFLEALQLFDRDWKKIETYVGSKTVIQIRSHAQKYFLKVQKKGTNEHLPPPRPKRKAAHPYPQKASKKNVLQLSLATRTEASCIFEQVYAPLEDVQSALGNSMATATVSSCVHNSVQPSFAVHLKDDTEPTGALILNDCCYSSSRSPQTSPTREINDQENSALLLPVVPDFAQVYSFLGSVFDSIAIDHSQELKEMDPIDIETVLLLMRNLSVNLNSPDFEAHRLLLSSCAEEMEEEIWR